jgi:hypothetical protein
MMRILVGMLAHQLNSEVVRRVHCQTWDDDDGYDVLTSWGQDIRPGESRFAAVTRKYQELQRKFLSGPWDCLLTVEQDMLIPPDALERLSRLVSDGADVAYSLYVWRYKEQHWWSAHPRLRVDEGVPYFWSLTHQPEEARRLWGQVVLVEGLGFGCTLISRHALVRLPFRQANEHHSQDTAFALDCRAEGLIQVADLGCVCGHRMEDGQVVWPDPEAPDLYRIEQGD